MNCSTFNLVFILILLLFFFFSFLFSISFPFSVPRLTPIFPGKCRNLRERKSSSSQFQRPQWNEYRGWMIASRLRLNGIEIKSLTFFTLEWNHRIVNFKRMKAELSFNVFSVILKTWEKNMVWFKDPHVFYFWQIFKPPPTRLLPVSHYIFAFSSIRHELSKSLIVWVILPPTNSNCSSRIICIICILHYHLSYITHIWF